MHASTPPILANSKDTALRTRARQVIPGGLWGHLNAANLPEGYPQFFARGEGCRVVDVDGREFVDFMCSWGPIVLGHHHPAVEEAARRQAALGDTLNGPAPVLVDLAEMMVDMIPHADWCLFEKNGGDATTAAVTIARAGTGRKKLLVARGSYHGAVPWCSPSLAGVTTEDRAHILHYEYNDVASLEAAVDQAGSDLAAVLVTAFRHDMAKALDLPDPAFARRMRELCTAADAALILDDVRAGFRLNLGGSWETVGVRPDLSCYSKAIANGYPLGAIAGSDRWREAATKIFTTGSFWCEAVPMAAAVATLSELKRIDGPALMARMGQRLRDGLSRFAARHGVAISQSGPPQMPLMLFDGDAGFAKGSAFCSAALRAGAYFHPKHNMFLACAHTEADIDRGKALVGRMG
jgi:glutamate-1-semialdehyde 2,1-aminomutase